MKRSRRGHWTVEWAGRHPDGGAVWVKVVDGQVVTSGADHDRKETR